MYSLQSGSQIIIGGLDSSTYTGQSVLESASVSFNQSSRPADGLTRSMR
jgi:hypothetical protein